MPVTVPDLRTLENVLRLQALGGAEHLIGAQGVRIRPEPFPLNVAGPSASAIARHPVTAGISRSAAPRLELKCVEPALAPPTVTVCSRSGPHCSNRMRNALPTKFRLEGEFSRSRPTCLLAFWAMEYQDVEVQPGNGLAQPSASAAQRGKMGLEFESAGKAFELANWRDSIQDRRELIRVIVVRVAEDGERLDLVLDEFKRAAGWFRMSDRDRNVLNVMFHDIRSIVWNWTRIASGDREAFVTGDIVPSTLAKRARALATPG